ncbi:MAG: hypothetical protein OEV78_05640 [Spirochaetia bacterium]|nr:hypothetical protein [Spirochaetia bacterium]
MNKNKWLTLFILLLLLGQRTMLAQSIQSPEKVKFSSNASTDLINKPDIEKESVLRRVEVVFLLSLPFTTIMSLLLFNSVYYISDTSYNFTMTKLPHEILPFTIFSAAFTSGIITYADYRTVQNQKNKVSQSSGKDNTRELVLGLEMEKKF